MKWSFKLARIAGIDVMVHWTFAILLFWLATVNFLNGNGLAEAAVGIAFVLAIFTCVVLHEFGHALVARRFGIQTADITLLPIGGVARLERMPEDPTQEFQIAIAGPLVNVGIAILLFVGIWLTSGLNFLFSGLLSLGQNFWVSMLVVNVVLVAFNMIPAFPMDGGRILRAVLARKMDYVAATEIAANVGQIIAIAFGVVGLFTNWFLIFIALFVYLGAQGEARMTLTRSMLAGVKVSDAMMTRFVTAAAQEPISILVEELLAGDQTDFPVVDGSRVLGIVRKQDLIQAIANGNMDASVESIMYPESWAIDENDLLRDTFESMQQATCQTLPVLRNGELVGLLNQTNIAEWLMIQSAMRDAKERIPPLPRQTDFRAGKLSKPLV